MLARAIANTYRKTKGVGSKQKNFSPKRFSVYDKTAIFSIQPYPVIYSSGSCGREAKLLII